MVWCRIRGFERKYSRVSFSVTARSRESLLWFILCHQEPVLWNRLGFVGGCRATRSSDDGRDGEIMWTLGEEEGEKNWGEDGKRRWCYVSRVPSD